MVGGLIVASNHQTYIDPFWVSYPIRRPVRYLAWDAAFNWPVVGSFSLFIVVYGSLLGAYIYHVVRVVRQGPEGADDPDAGRVLVPSHPAAVGRREAT